MKKILLIILCTGMLLSANIVQAQQDSGSQEDLGAAALQEVQKSDPAAAQAITNAVQRGDLQGAKTIYQNFKKPRPEQPVKSATPQAVAAPPPTSSLFEQTLPGNLTQFGYALFNKTVSTFTIPATMPVGPDYIIGPGDQFTLTLWGTTEGIFNLQVTKEGTVTLPKVGVVQVAGIRFGELEKTIKSHLSRYYNDFNLSIAMGGLKTLTIYVVGEVVTPGSYSLSSLTSVYGALFSAGGPTKMGSLRTIQVLRSGKVIKTLDLYDFLLKGNRSQDIKLQNEDTVFVPLIGPVAGVSGTVYRPAIYELKGQETLSDLIETAGGLLPVALGGRLQLTRYIDNQRKVFLDITLDNAQAGATRSSGAFQEKVRNMDAVSIRPMYEGVWETVELSGAVKNPGSVQWRHDLRLREVVMQGQLLPKTDMRRADVVRIKKEMIERTIIPVDLAALMAGDESQNILLEPKDKIVIYNVDQNPSNVWETVNLSGAVRNPGNFQWRPDLKVREIIIQGQLLPQADMKRVDVVRIKKEMTERTIIPVNLAALMGGDESQNILLEPKDKIVVYNVDQNPSNVWETVNLSGIVRNSGNFQWRPDLKVREIIIQGQLLPQSDMNRADVIRLNKNLMDRTVIPVDLNALMAGDESKNITLEPQDQVRVYSSLKGAEKVTVSGEVVRAGDYEINKEEHLSDLMRRVGGFTANAYPYGAVFKRAAVKNSEAKSAKALITKTQSEIIQNAVARTATAVTPEEAQFVKVEQSLNQSLLENLKALQETAEGRVAISITENIDEWAGTKQDLLLQNGDSLMVPKRPQEVLVLGEVFTPGAQIFLPEMSVGDYLSRTGGLTRNADSSQIFVVRADGFSFGPKSLSSGSIEEMKLQAGDAVFVPQKVEREAALRTTKDIIDIIFKAAVIFATIHLLF